MALGLAWPAAAQRGAQPQPVAGEVCAPIGQAVAVMGDTSLAAEAMGAQATLAGNTGSRPPARTLVAYAPAAVGACADLQAFWGDTAGGKVVATLALLDDQGNSLAKDDAGASRDRGPARHTEPLKALVKLEEPKTYHFVATLEVKAAGAAASNVGTRPAEASDALKVAFAVEVRERPQPRPQDGFVAGIVKNADGGPIEGATVNLSLGANAVTPPNPRRPFGGGSVLPVVPRSLLQDSAGAEPIADDPAPGAPDQNASGRLAAVTGPDGAYRIAAAPGKYLVTASAGGYHAQWYNGATGPDGATPVEVKAGETAAGVDFNLQAKPVAVVTGVVSGANGAAVAGASVMAVARPPSPNATTRATATTRTDADGKFTLKLDPGTYAIGAQMPALSSARPGKTVWWDGKAELKDADLLELADGVTRDGVDFRMP